jgi:hypothetical protein
MAYTDPSGWNTTTSHVTTAAELNTYIKDNLDYLYSKRPAGVVQTDQTANRAFTTVYHNNADTVRFCSVTGVASDTPFTFDLKAYCDSGANTTIVSYGSWSPGYTNTVYGTLFFAVPASYYYHVIKDSAVTVTLSKWTEWTM